MFQAKQEFAKNLSVRLLKLVKHYKVINTYVWVLLQCWSELVVTHIATVLL